MILISRRCRWRNRKLRKGFLAWFSILILSILSSPSLILTYFAKRTRYCLTPWGLRLWWQARTKEARLVKLKWFLSSHQQISSPISPWQTWILGRTLQQVTSSKASFATPPDKTNQGKKTIQLRHHQMWYMLLNHHLIKKIETSLSLPKLLLQLNPFKIFKISLNFSKVSR